MTERNFRFIGCKHLDFNRDAFGSDCQRNAMLSGQDQIVFWHRIGKQDNKLVQFCKKRGRLNDPRSCTDMRYARCPSYSEIYHELVVPADELES